MDIYDDYEHDFVNYALQTCLWNLNTLHEPSARKLFIKLKTEWFSSLGISSQEMQYFDNEIDYTAYELIKSIGLDDLDAYNAYKALANMKKENFIKSRGKISLKLSLYSRIILKEVLDRLTFIKNL